LRRRAAGKEPVPVFSENKKTTMRENIYNEDERQYLQMMQDNIARMANNSANCKNWMVMIVAAIFAVSCGLTEMNWWLLLTLLPIVLFWRLDAFYLRLERGMRNRLRLFLNIVHSDNMDFQKYNIALFNFRPYPLDKELTEVENRHYYTSTKGCWQSESILPFYLTAIVVVLIIVVVLNWNGIVTLFTPVPVV
jgi:hypothetical protein